MTPSSPAFVPSVPVTTASLRLDVDAYQDGNTNSAGTLYMKVLIDGQLRQEFPVIFEGSDAFARQRRRIAVEVTGVPVGRRSVSVLASTDREGHDPVQGSAEMHVTEGTNRAYVHIRYMSPTDRSLRLR